MSRTITTYAEFTRPANTDALAALDVVGPAVTANLTFTQASGGTRSGGIIKKARLLTDQKTNTSAYRLHLYTTAPTAIADNAPYLLLYADRTKHIGAVEFAAATTEDSSNSTAASSTNLTVELAFQTATGTLYGILETVGGFTPASAQKFFVELTIKTDA